MTEPLAKEVRYDLWHNPDCICTAVPRPSAQGQWILFADYESIRAERDALKGEVAGMDKVLSDQGMTYEKIVKTYAEHVADLTRQLAASEQAVKGAVTTREQALAWRRADEQMLLGLHRIIDDVCGQVNAECENGCGTKARALLQQALTEPS